MINEMHHQTTAVAVPKHSVRYDQNGRYATYRPIPAIIVDKVDLPKPEQDESEIRLENLSKGCAWVVIGLGIIALAAIAMHMLGVFG